MAGIEKVAAKDKESSELKAKNMEKDSVTGAGPSNRVDLDAEDEYDEFILKYDPEKMGLNGDDYEEVDDYALVETGIHRDMDGEIIYQGSKKKAQIPPPSELATEQTVTTSEVVITAEKNAVPVNGGNVIEDKAPAKPPPDPKKLLKKYNQWGFVAATSSGTGSSIPPPPPGAHVPPPPLPDDVSDGSNPAKRSRWN